VFSIGVGQDCIAGSLHNRWGRMSRRFCETWEPRMPQAGGWPIQCSVCLRMFPDYGTRPAVAFAACRECNFAACIACTPNSAPCPKASGWM
jgi:hypothetical protein